VKPVRYLAPALLSLALSGCASNLARQAVVGATTGQAQADINSLASTAGTAAGQAAASAARNELLGPATSEMSDTLVKKLAADIGIEIRRAISRELIRSLIDEALGQTTLTELDVARERLVGRPLQYDLDALIDAEVPRLAQAISAAVSTQVKPLTAEATKWEPLAIGLGAGSFFLLAALITMLHHHRQVIRIIKGQA
jgi:hypothetical protein